MSLMMNTSQRASHSIFAIIITLLCSLVLTIVPLPDWMSDYRPAWVSLTLIYWAMMAPERVGIGVAWVMGLLLDALQGTLLGEQALLCMLVVLVSGKMHQRLRLFPLLQQCVFVFLLLGIQFIIMMWIQGISGEPIQGWHHGFSVIISTLIWPAMYGLFRWARI